MTSSRLRSLPSARRICNPSPLPLTAIPAESYPRYSKRLKPSRMTGTTRFLPTYPTIPHMQTTPNQGVGRLPTQTFCFPARSCKLLFFKGIPKLLDYRIGQNFTCDPPNLVLDLRLVQSSIECELKNFSLPHVLQPFVTQLVERSLDGLALRIQNAPLQRNIHVCFHGDGSLYGTLQPAKPSDDQSTVRARPPFFLDPRPLLRTRKRRRGLAL